MDCSAGCRALTGDCSGRRLACWHIPSSNVYPRDDAEFHSKISNNGVGSGDIW